jgi:hypothetical protein
MLKSQFLSSVAGLGVLSDGSLDSCRIVQGMSAERKRGDKRYRPDARIGSFFFEGRDPPLIDGEEGFHAVWIHLRPAIVETPADGSFGTLAVYKNAPDDALWRDELTETGKTHRVFRRMANNNLLTRTLFGCFALIDNDGCVDFDALYQLRFTGRAAGAFHRNVVKALGRRSNWIPDENDKLHAPPIFGVTTHVVSELAGNDLGDWYVPSVAIVAKFGDPGGPTEQDLEIAAEIYEERTKLAELSYTPTPNEAAPAPAPIQPRPTPTPQLGGTAAARFTSGIANNNEPRPFAPLPDRAPEGPDLSDIPF